MTDSSKLSCPACGAHLKARAELAGRRVRCPRCGGPVAVPGSEPAGETASPADRASAPAEDRPRIVTDPTPWAAPVADRTHRSASAGSRGSSRTRFALWAGLLLLAATVVGGLGFWLGRTSVPATSTVAASAPNQPGQNRGVVGPSSPHAEAPSGAAEPSAGEPTSAISAGTTVAPPVADRVADPSTLWESPTNGEPVDFGLIPLPARLLVALRPRELAAHRDGAIMAAALRPALNTWLSQWESLLESPLDQWDTLLAGCWSGADGQLIWSLAAEAPQPLSPPADSPGTRQEQAGETWFEQSGRIRWLPRRAGGRWLVIGPADTTAELATGPAINSADRVATLAELIAASDRRRLVTCIAPVDFLEADGQRLWQPALPGLLGWMRLFTGDETRAAMLSIHLDDDFFSELRLVPRPGSLVASLAECRGRVAQLSAQASRSLGTLAESADSRPSVAAIPPLLAAFTDWTTVAADERQLVLRTYLPSEAGPNLAAALRVAISGAGQAKPLAAAAPGTAPADEQLSAAQRMERVISLVIPRNALETALQLFSGEVGVPLEIAGADLEREGITRNQSLAIDIRDRPASQVLEAILLEANPDGKLTYRIEPDSSGRERIVITTQAARSGSAGASPPGT